MSESKFDLDTLYELRESPEALDMLGLSEADIDARIQEKNAEAELRQQFGDDIESVIEALEQDPCIPVSGFSDFLELNKNRI